MDKVYCINCEYLSGDEAAIWLCDYPENIEYQDCWFKRIKNNKREPNRINKDNNCKWYKDKHGTRFT